MREPFLQNEGTYSLAKEEEKIVTPHATASAISIAFFRWLDPLFAAGSKRPLQLEDLPWLGERNSAAFLFQRLRGSSIWDAIWRPNRKLVIASGIVSLLHVLASYAGPFLVADFVAAYGTSPGKGFALVSGFLLAKISANLLERQRHFMLCLLGLRVESSLACHVFHKALKSSRVSTGEVVNLVTSDVRQVGWFCWEIHSVWTLPLEALLGLIILYRDVGLASFASVGALIACTLCNVPLASIQEKSQGKMMRERDCRMRATAESLRSMRTLKLHGWEESFLRKMERLRAAEYAHLSRYSYVQALSKYVFATAPSAMAVVAVALMAKLQPGKILSAVAVFRMLQSMQDGIPDFISSLVGVCVSMQRLSKFFEASEVESRPEFTGCGGGGAAAAIEVRAASFSWDRDPEHPTLKDINLEVPKRCFVAITGAVGSAKSSLLSCILGQMPKLCGEVIVRGTTAYVSQWAWIQHATVKENILFGSEMNKEKYDKIISSCQLKRDLEMLSHGDETRIGDRGVTLSGGQKQRLQLARAMYKDADIYLLDDPLSALDTQTSRDILKECIQGILCTKTVLLVTHHLQSIQMADKVIVMANGSLSVDCAEQSRAAAESATMDESSNQDRKEDPAEIQQKLEEPEAAEQRECGSVSGGVYWAYLTSVYRGALIPVILVSLAIYQGLQAAATWEVARPRTSKAKLVMVFGLLSLGSSLASLCRVLLVAVVGLKTSQKFFLGMYRSVFLAPMSFFDTTPIGRILNRASTDQTSVDISVPLRLSELAGYMTELVTIIVIVSFVSWHVLPVFAFLASVAYCLQRYYIKTIRELPRLMEIQRAPIVHHFEESLSGLATIRAFHREPQFLERLFHLVDVNNRPQFHNFASMEFLALRIGVLADVFFCALMLLLVASPKSPGSAGVAVTYALSLTTVLTWTLWSRVDTEKRIISAERLLQYTQLHYQSPRRGKHVQPAEDWPQLGTLELKEVKVRYKPSAPMALCGISCKFPAGKKVGILGRTGSGKSTLVQAIFRTVELTSGQILIDSLDISAVDVHLLRSKLSIIPQDPVLFEGSIRYNLDPLSTFSDDRIWEVLRKCELMTAVASKGAGLDSLVSGDGENWSMGQRQLLCLGRVLLKQSRIVVLDEATASIDSATERIIQTRIAENFQECTVVTIAHRLATILSNTDLVAVLQNGKLVEFDTPPVLSSNPSSAFATLLRNHP
ncbi:ABC transporter C family member 13 [Selaginella moellendorffii]|uniref:ABC transporter C family member 13 n=1 Tax=Selaginella moellendorffii TaxID=88036 RepID=UPI000D1C42AE|nr:ABC transporter C family member 13 [Selaginella moellendorffii]|eukprot:XP_024540237.1 ABC transporter C family member 13 [Selaginella moellendorffii]